MSYAHWSEADDDRKRENVEINVIDEKVAYVNESKF
jgi:hypothetical protein